MKSTEIEHNVQHIIDNFSKEEFIYDLLIAYGISKTSVTRLKKGDYNLSKVEGEILYKKKIFFKVEASNKLLSSIDEISKEKRILKHKPRFAILTDYKHIVAKDLKLGTNLDIEIKELPNYFDFFLPLAGSEVYNAKVTFVTTNSICQGEQVALIWPNILSEQVEIDFAHKSFKWTNNAKGNAGVTVIILGLRNVSNEPKYLFKDNFRKLAKNINPYLLDTTNTIVTGKSKPISNFPEISFGSMANDGGNLLLSEQEKDELISKEPKSKKLIKKLVGALEFIRGVNKYCLWIEDENKEFAISLPIVKERIDKTEVSRLNSKRKTTQELSSIPHKFAEIRYLPTDSIIIPSVSSEKRQYIPIGFLNPNEIIVAPNFAIYYAQPWLFAVVTSRMHMTWVRAVGGKLKTDYRYSAKLCYNTFPFPNITTKQKENLNLYVFAILDERAKHPSKTMAQLYNPDTIPKGLLKAHQEWILP